MLRVMLLALGFLLARASTQEGLQRPTQSGDVAAVALRGAVCPISISKLQSEKTDDGWRLRITVTNASDVDAGLVELHFFTFAAQGPFLRASHDYVDTADLPVPAHGTKDTAATAPPLKDGEHLRVGAVVPGDSDCAAVRMKQAALREFEPADFVIAKPEGIPFMVTDAQIKADAHGKPQVIYTVEDSAPAYVTDNVQVAVIAFIYSERLGGFTVLFGGRKAFTSGRSAAGVINLNLPPLPDTSSKWKFAVLPIEGVFGGHQWQLPGAKAGSVASAMLYAQR